MTNENHDQVFAINSLKWPFIAEKQVTSLLLQEYIDWSLGKQEANKKRLYIYL